MTKTLTEQWREGTLEQRYYYVKYFGNCQKPFVEIELKNFLLDLVKVKDRDKIEVLAPVPSYDEYKKLEQQLAELQTEENNLLNDIVDLNLTIENRDKKLEIATKALKRYEDKQNWDIRGVSFMKYNKGFTIAHKALKEMEGVK